MQKYSNTIEVCSIGSDQSLLFCDLCACVQETREGCIDISVVFEGNLGIGMLVKVTTYAYYIIFMFPTKSKHHFYGSPSSAYSLRLQKINLESIITYAVKKSPSISVRWCMIRCKLNKAFANSAPDGWSYIAQ